MNLSKELNSPMNERFNDERETEDEEEIQTEPFQFYAANDFKFKSKDSSRKEGLKDGLSRTIVKPKISDLIGTLRKDRNQFRTSKISLLDVPAVRREQEKIQRTIGYEETVRSVGKWDDIIKENRKLKQVIFPMDEMGLKMFNAPKKTTDQKIREMQSSMKKQKMMLSYMAAKMKRQGKIKSKKYRQILRKGREKDELKNLKDIDSTAYHEWLMKEEKSRIEERMTLKHKGKSRNMKKKALYNQYNSENRNAVQEMLRKGKELTVKRRPAGSMEDDDDDLANSDAESKDGEGVEREEEEGEGKIEPDDVYYEVPVSYNVNRPDVKDGVIWSDNSSSDDEYNNHMNRNNNNNNNINKNNNNINKKNNNNNNSNNNNIESSGCPGVQRQGPKSRREEKKKAIVLRTDAVLISVPRTNNENNNKNKNNNNDKNHDDDDEEGGGNSSGNFKADGNGRGSEKFEGYNNNNNINNKNINNNKNNNINNNNNSFKGGKRSSDNNPCLVTTNSKSSHGNTCVVVTNSNSSHGNPCISSNNGDRYSAIREAFEEDEGVVEDFERDKEELVEGKRLKDIDMVLPGWNEWIGPGLKVSNKKKKRFTFKAPTGTRRDSGKFGLILNEEKLQPLARHQVSSLPWTFHNVHDFEKKISHPLGKQWNNHKDYSENILPRVVVRAGKIIKPISSYLD